MRLAMLTKETTDGKVLIHSYRETGKETRTMVCIDCGKAFIEEVKVYLDAEIESEDGTRQQYGRVSFVDNERCPDCMKIPKRRFFYALGRMWKEDEERRKTRH